MVDPVLRDLSGTQIKEASPKHELIKNEDEMKGLDSRELSPPPVTMAMDDQLLKANQTGQVDFKPLAIEVSSPHPSGTNSMLTIRKKVQLRKVIREMKDIAAYQKALKEQYPELGGKFTFAVSGQAGEHMSEDDNDGSLFIRHPDLPSRRD